MDTEHERSTAPRDGGETALQAAAGEGVAEAGGDVSSDDETTEVDVELLLLLLPSWRWCRAELLTCIKPTRALQAVNLCISFNVTTPTHTDRNLADWAHENLHDTAPVSP